MFLRFVAIGDEAAFQMNRIVTTRNVRCYAPKHHPPLEHGPNRCQGRNFRCGLDYAETGSS